MVIAKMDISQVIKQDLKAASSAFDSDDFRLMNIFANRIMSNSILGEDSRSTLVGFFLREIARIYGQIKAREELTIFTTAKSHGYAYIKSIKLENDVQAFWEQYHDFLDKTREYTLNKHEKESYEKDIKFTHFAFSWLLERLDRDRTIFFNDKNQFLRGILNEMDRIFRCHGGELIDLYALSLLKALQLYYDYIDYFFGKDEKHEIIEKSLLSYVNEITKALSKDTIDSKEVIHILRRIIVDWRLYFIYFMERPQIVQIREEEKVPITEETKKKISEVVAKAFQEEVK